MVGRQLASESQLALLDCPSDKDRQYVAVRAWHTSIEYYLPVAEFGLGMSEDPLSIVKRQLNDAIEEVDDSEVRFKLRTASQYIDVANQRKADAAETADGAGSDDWLRDTTGSRLGYSKPLHFITAQLFRVADQYNFSHMILESDP